MFEKIERPEVVFNDLAVASNRLIEEGDAARIAIIDLDVHQGDGTASLTATREDIATLSVHAEKNFPVRKARSNIDIGLPDDTTDAAYMTVLENHIPKHASQMYSANLTNFVSHFWDTENATFNLNLDDEIIQGCLITHNGAIVHPRFKK